MYCHEEVTFNLEEFNHNRRAHHLYNGHNVLRLIYARYDIYFSRALISPKFGYFKFSIHQNSVYIILYNVCTYILYIIHR